jgi:hypothetical protein
MNIWKELKRKINDFIIKVVKLKRFDNAIGIVCPRCKQTGIDYDRMLNLRCKACGYQIIGSFT